MAQKAVHINGFYTNKAILDYAIHSDHIKAYMYFTACLIKENMWGKKTQRQDLKCSPVLELLFLLHAAQCCHHLCSDVLL